MPEVIVKVSVDVEIKVEVEDVVKSIVLVDRRSDRRKLIPNMQIFF